MTGFEDKSTETLTIIAANLRRGLDRVAEHIDAGTFHTVGPKGAAPPSQSGQITLALLKQVDAELDRRAAAARSGDPMALPPVWLLDVDGVIDATQPGWGAAPRKRGAWSASDSREYTMRWAPALVDRIRALHKAGTVEVRWCTTWCADADVLERLWHLPRLERAFTDPLTPEAAAMAKLGAARQVLDDGRRLIWTDDLEVPTSGDLYDELTKNGRALLIRPHERRGLQPDDLDAIEAFAAGEGI